MAEIVMPRLSDTMEEGTILRWLKQRRRAGRARRGARRDRDRQGDDDLRVRPGGRAANVAREGDTLAVGAPIARVGGSRRRRRARTRPRDADGAPASAGAGGRAATRRRTARRSGECGAAPSPAAAQGRVKASPLARRMARESGVDLGRSPAAARAGASSRPTSSGAGGTPAAASGAARRAHDRPRPASRRARAPGRRDARRRAPEPAGCAGVATAKGETTTVELSRTQQTIARRMAESKATIPDFTLQTDVDMEACVALRAELKRLAAAGEAPTYNDMSSRPARSRCASTRAPTAATATGACSCTRASTSAWPSRSAREAAARWSCRPCSTPTPSRSARSRARRARWPSACATGRSRRPSSAAARSPSPTSGCTACAASPRSSTRRRRRSSSVGALAPRAVVRDGELAARHTMTRHARLRPPHPLRRRRRAVPRAHPRAAGAARRADAVSPRSAGAREGYASRPEAQERGITTRLIGAHVASRPATPTSSWVMPSLGLRRATARRSRPGATCARAASAGETARHPAAARAPARVHARPPLGTPTS